MTFGEYAQQKEVFPVNTSLTEMLALMHSRPGSVPNGERPVEMPNALLPVDAEALTAKARQTQYNAWQVVREREAEIKNEVKQLERSTGERYVMPKMWTKDERRRLRELRRNAGVFMGAHPLHKGGGFTTNKRQ